MTGPTGGRTVGAGGRTVGAGTPARPAAWPDMAATLALHELRVALRRGESLLVTFVIPVGVLLVFSAFDMGGEGAGIPTGVQRLLPASIALAIIAAALVSLAIGTAFERQYGVLKRLGGSPAGSSVVVAAKTIAVIVVEAVQLLVLVGLAVAVLGFVAGPGASIPLVVAGLVLGTVAFAGLGLLMAGTLRAEATLALANLLFLLALVLGGIVVPLERLPSAITSVAEVLPPAALVKVLGVGLGAVEADATEALAILAGWAAVLAVLAARRFHWD
jgi:ABC-2 type transport system permease protein